MGEREQLAADIRAALHTWPGGHKAFELLRRALAVLEPEEPARPEQCQTCGSDDPRKCRSGAIQHEHSGEWDVCCPSPWHSGGGQ